MKRAFFDEDDDNWKLQALIESNAGSAIGGGGGGNGGALKRPVSAAGQRRPVSEYAKIAARGGNPRYKGENILQVSDEPVAKRFPCRASLMLYSLRG